MNYSKKIALPSGLRGMGLLDTPIWNKGTVFDDNERATFGLQRLRCDVRQPVRERGYEDQRHRRESLQQLRALVASSESAVTKAFTADQEKP